MDLFGKIFGKSASKELENVIKEGAFLVDVRTSGEFARGHAICTVNIPLDQISTQLPKFKNKKGVVVCCLSGSRSAQAKTLLEKNGVAGVVNAGNWQNVARLCRPE